MTDTVIFLTRKLPRREGLTPSAPGPTINIRIVRECGRWRAGQTGAINADYGRQLIHNGLAEEVGPKVGKAAPTGQRVRASV